MTDNLIQMATPILTVIGVFVAAYGIMRNTENAKKRATIDMIMVERNNAALQEAITIVKMNTDFAEIRKSKGMRHFAFAPAAGGAE